VGGGGSLFRADPPNGRLEHGPTGAAMRVPETSGWADGRRCGETIRSDHHTTATWLSEVEWLEASPRVILTETRSAVTVVALQRGVNASHRSAR
jgi:hypothetical protein